MNNIGWKEKQRQFHQKERRSTWFTMVLFVAVVYIGVHIVLGINRVADRTFEYKQGGRTWTP